MRSSMEAIMVEQAATPTRYDLEAKIVKRCWEDEAFRQEFTADPVGTAVKYLEVPAANLPNIVVHEEPTGSWHIVLPAKPAGAGELSEADLEKVAGGTTPFCWVSAVTAASSVVASTIIAVSMTVDQGW
jgi:hypothetical protein